jgi:predicted transcriptional regulator
MKLAISMPDDISRSADRLARRLRMNRSQLVSQAVAEFVARHQPDTITASLNDVCAQLACEDGFTRAASEATLGQSEW